jgi:biotin transport system substrate-specific component
MLFGFGVLWLGTLIGWDKPVLEFGFTPFIAGAVFKILLSAAVLPLAWKFLKRS